MSILKWLNSSSLYVEVSPSNPLPVNATVTASAAALASTSAPSYSDGTTNPLSADLTGALRITGTINASSSMHSTTAAPSYVNGTDNALSSNLTGDLRTIAKQNGTWTVGISSAQVIGIDQTTPGTTNAVDVTNFPVTVDVNSGVKSNSTIRIVLATDQPALTNALKVDGSAVTQPVSGTVTANLGTIAGVATAAKQPALGTAGAASTDVLSVQGIASMTPFLCAQSGAWNITNISGTISLPTGAATAAGLTTINTTLGTPFQAGGSIGNTTFASTQSGTWNIGTVATITTCATVTSLTQFNGNTIDTNSGNKSAGTLRTLIATDALAVPLWGHGTPAATAPTNAVYAGLLGKTALPTAVSDGQMVGAMADKFGRQITRTAPRELLQTASITTTGTSGTLLASQGTGVFADMYRLVIANSSAAAVLVSVSDGTNTYPYEVPANGTVGFSGPSCDATPAASSATAWTYTVASGTTTIYIHAQFILNK